MEKKKWEYTFQNSGFVARATNMLFGENEQIITRKHPKWKNVGYEEEKFGPYGLATDLVSEEVALKAALSLGATKEDFYAE